MILQVNQPITDCLHNGHTVVTATARLASHILAGHARSRTADGSQSWETPDVLPWKSWLQRLWRQRQPTAGEAPLLLNPQQQKLVWQAIIDSSNYSRNILHVNALVTEAIRSYTECMTWCIPIFPDDCYLNEDARAFQSWVGHYRQRLETENWIDLQMLPDYLIEQGLDQTVCADTAFCGFDYTTPQRQAMLQALRQQGLQAKEIQAEAVNRHASRHAFADTDAELAAAARYAGEVCLQGQGETVGIVVPNLQQDRERIVSVLQRVLNPGSLLVEGGDRRPLFSVSLGKPLLQYAPVRTALTVLALGKRRIAFSDLSLLLHSIHIGGAETESAARATLELALRHNGEQGWYSTTLLRRLQKLAQGDAEATMFVQMLQQVAQAVTARRGKQRVAEWVALFSQLLDIAVWPGERELDSNEYQIINAWNDCLQTLTSLDYLLGKIDYNQALARLAVIVSETHFQPESAETPVQVLHPTSAAAMQFDHLWLLGLHDTAWPPPLSAYPYIPAVLREESAMPFGSSRRNYEHAGALLQSLVSSAGQVVLSYAAMEKDIQHGPSPLLRQYSPADAAALPPPEDFREVIRQAANLQQLHDDVCACLPSAMVRGGTGIITDQARCPFRAFARHRLRAEGLPPPGIGLDPMQRGSLVHLAMQNFWQQVGTQADLVALDDQQRREILQQAVQKAMQRELDKQPEIINDNFMQTETQRLLDLLDGWLESEKSRPAFTVQEMETRHTLPLDGIECVMRIDRIDSLPDGSKVILDYKTGNVNFKHWFGDRPEDMQLPIYAVSQEQQLTAVAYACIKQGEHKFAGVSQDTGLLPGVRPPEDDWEAQLQQWRDTLDDLAQEFRQGRAAVDPIHSTVCRYCDLGTLCRINEAGGSGETDDGD
ncbi:MAG: PD-(D/E)XK nuclease family protein [Gammaproteobacteria bacterium]